MCCSTREWKITGSLAHSLRRGELVPYRVRVGAGSGVRLEEWLRWSAHPLGGAMWGIMRRTLLLLGVPQKWQLGFLSFCILLFITCPNLTCMQLFLVLSSFFVFYCWSRHLSRCKHCSKGSQVPACLTSWYIFIPFQWVVIKFNYMCHLGYVLIYW